MDRDRKGGGFTAWVIKRRIWLLGAFAALVVAADALFIVSTEPASDTDGRVAGVPTYGHPIVPGQQHTLIDIAIQRVESWRSYRDTVAPMERTAQGNLNLLTSIAFTRSVKATAAATALEDAMPVAPTPESRVVMDKAATVLHEMAEDDRRLALAPSLKEYERLDDQLNHRPSRDPNDPVEEFLQTVVP